MTVHVHVCAPPTTWGRGILRCPTCRRRRRFVVFFQPWYGGTWTCCGCGDSFADGQRLPRPFRRGWRADATRDARARWATAAPWRDAARSCAEADW